MEREKGKEWNEQTREKTKSKEPRGCAVKPAGRGGAKRRLFQKFTLVKSQKVSFRGTRRMSEKGRNRRKNGRKISGGKEGAWDRREKGVLGRTGGRLCEK